MTNDSESPESPSRPESTQPLAPPPLPVPVISVPEPIPVAALAYSTPTYSYNRPSILTGVGVCSIIVAIISGLASLMQGCQSIGIMVIAQTAKSSRPGGTVIPPPVTVAPVVVAPSPAPVVQVPPSVPAPVVTRANGLDVADRATAIAALDKIRALSAPRQTELELFLAEHGQKVFPTGGRALTAAQVRANVSRSNDIPPGDDDSGGTQYVTVWGTLTVYDNRAEFNPSGVSQPLVTSTSPTAAGAQAGIMPYSPLTQAQVQQAIAAVQIDASMTLNPAQTAALTAQLQNPQQTYVPTANIAMPVASALDLGNGLVWIMFSGGSCIEIDANGIVTASNIMAMSPLRSANVTGTSVAMVLLEAMASALLAILLLVAILLFRDASSSRKIHLAFAGLKIVVAVLGWIAMMHFVEGMFAGGRGRTAVPLSGPFTAATAFYCIALIYPIALFFIFSLRGVREYYNSVR